MHVPPENLRRPSFLNVSFYSALLTLGFFLVLVPIGLRLMPPELQTRFAGLPQSVKLILAMYPMPLCLIAVVTIPALCSSKAHLFFRRFQLRMPGKNDLFLILRNFFIALILSYPVSSVLTSICKLFGWIPKQQILVDLALKMDFSLFLLSAAGAILVAPVAEELVFRFVLYQKIRLLIPFRIAALVLPSFLFAAVHDFSIKLPALFILGIILQLTYRQSCSLTNAILLHALNNAFSFLLLFLVRIAMRFGFQIPME